MNSDSVKDSIPAGNTLIDNSKQGGRVTPPNASGDDDSDWKMQSKKDEESLSTSSRSVSSASGYSPTSPNISKHSFPAANEPSARMKDIETSPGAVKRGGSSFREDRELGPSPYFYYVDHSRDVELPEDFLTPLSPALSVPNFVIKLHAMLVCDSLSDVIGWMPHGRSWKILNQSRFEKLVLSSVYFKQTRIASFYRQANGWGFRCMLKGADKGSFYHEEFLRGCPFLCKKMKRIGRANLAEGANISHEPILWKISAENPLPQEVPNDSLDYAVLNTINKCVREGGPQAKVPFVHATFSMPINEPSLHQHDIKSRNILPSSPGVSVPSHQSTATRNVSLGSLGTELSSREGLNRSQIEEVLQRHQSQLNNDLLDGRRHLSVLEHQIQMQQLQLQSYQANQLLLQRHTEKILGMASLVQHQDQQQQNQAAMPQANTANLFTAPIASPTVATAPLQAYVANMTNATILSGPKTSNTMVFPQITLQEDGHNILRLLRLRQETPANDLHSTQHSRVVASSMIHSQNVQQLNQGQYSVPSLNGQTSDSSMMANLWAQYLKQNQK